MIGGRDYITPKRRQDINIYIYYIYMVIYRNIIYISVI